MDKAESALKDLKNPAMASVAAVCVGVALKKIFNTESGVNTNSFTSALKAFVLITIAGGAANWYNKE